MQRYAIRAIAAAAMAGGLFAASSALAQPNCTIDFQGGKIAFIAGINWGSGTLRCPGHPALAIRVSGIGVGAIGANSFSATGEVTNITNPHDIVGTYTAIAASATAGAGGGVLDMTNQKGVRIQARSTSAGLALSLAPTGMTIALK